jgi:hypothetical protein
MLRCGRVTGEGKSLVPEIEAKILKQVREYLWSDLVSPQKVARKEPVLEIVTGRSMEGSGVYHALTYRRVSLMLKLYA